MVIDVFQVLRQAKACDASDVQLVAGSVPQFRVYGKLGPAEKYPVLAADDVVAAFHQLASPGDIEGFARDMELDFGYSLAGVGRLRCNVAKQELGLSMHMRLLSQAIPTIEELELPNIYLSLAERKRGLVVVSGPVDSGKTTTLAAMVNHLNVKGGYHIVTVEDPIEYIHSSVRSVTTQRQLGRDTLSYASALKHVLRQNPGVILVGEMRDNDTAAAVLSVAETGHLVLTTGHASDAPHCVERIIDLFPPEERALAQARLASLLVAILVQTLVPRADGTGRVAAVEVMLNNNAIASLIREGKVQQIPNFIRTNEEEGMMTMDDSLVRLYHAGTITAQTALDYCHNPVEVNKLMGVRTAAARKRKAAQAS